MTTEEKKALLAGIFQGADLKHAQINLIVESGAKVVYQEQGELVRDVPHFPLQKNEHVGRQWFEFLVEKGFVTPDTELSCWLFLMGFSTAQPSEVRPIEWMKTVETARMMLCKVFADMIEAKTITKARIRELASQCFTKQGEPLRLAKPKAENTWDAKAIADFLPTVSDL
jgi:hypothetical protein